MTNLIVGGVKMHHNLPIMLGAGVCKFVPSLMPYLRDDLPCGALEPGSFTVPPRPGNPGSPQWPESYEVLRQYHAGVNCWSMPNAGGEETAKELALVESPIPVVANIAGSTPEEFSRGQATFQSLTQVKAVTHNKGCPNTENLPVSYDLDLNRSIHDAVERIEPTKPVWEKLSPFITKEDLGMLEEALAPLRVDLSQVPTAPADFFEEVLDMVVDYPFVKAVIIGNTLGNVRILNSVTGQPVIDVNDGKAGLSGDVLRDLITMPLVKRAVAFLQGRIDVIACGGVFEGQHVIDYLKAGAKAVQCVSGPTWNGGPRFFQNLIAESPALQEYLETHYMN